MGTPTTAPIPGLPDALDLLLAAPAANPPVTADGEGGRDERSVGHVPDAADPGPRPVPAVSRGGSSVTVQRHGHPGDDLAAVLLAADTSGRGAVRLTDAVDGLDIVRRLESMLSWAKHRLVLETMRAAEAEHERRVELQSGEDTDAGEDHARAGLSRRQREAVGERNGLAEIACVLQIGESAASHLLLEAELLAEHVPDTDAALRDGLISAAAATVITAEAGEYAADLPAAVDAPTVDRLRHAIAATEGGLLDLARRGVTKAKLTARATRLRQKCHPRSFDERCREAMADRFVRVSPDRDGMARLYALLPAAVAHRIDGRLSAIAKQLLQIEPTGGGDTAAAGEAGRVTTFGVSRSERVLDGPDSLAAAGRTVVQLRADVLADLLGGLISDDGWWMTRRGLTGVDPALAGGGRAATARGERAGHRYPSALDGDGEDPPDGPGSGRPAVTTAAPTVWRGRRSSSDEAPPPERRGGPPVEPSWEPPVEPSWKPPVEPRGGPPVEPRGGPPVEPSWEPPVEPSWEPPVEPRGGPPGETDCGRVPQVVLTMPAATILGGDDPGTLGAFGPIAAEDARRLAGLAASFTLVVTHDGSPPGTPEPTTVVPVAVTDGRQYRIPAPLRRALAARDITCRFPGCRAVAARCDVDHVEAWAAGGPTEAGNLAHLCRKHHVLKHHSAWTVEAEPASASKRPRPLPPRTIDGEDAYESEGRECGAERLTWTSPAGRQYVTAPEPPPF